MCVCVCVCVCVTVCVCVCVCVCDSAIFINNCFFPPFPLFSLPLPPPLLPPGDPHSSSEYKPGFLTDDELKQLVVEVCYHGNNTALHLHNNTFSTAS